MEGQANTHSLQAHRAPSSGEKRPDVVPTGPRSRGKDSDGVLGVLVWLFNPLSENLRGLRQPRPPPQGLPRWGVLSSTGWPSLQTPAMCQGSPGLPVFVQLPIDSKVPTTRLTTDHSLAHRTLESARLTITFSIKDTRQNQARGEMHRESGSPGPASLQRGDKTPDWGADRKACIHSWKKALLSWHTSGARERWPISHHVPGRMVGVCTCAVSLVVRKTEVQRRQPGEPQSWAPAHGWLASGAAPPGRPPLPPTFPARRPSQPRNPAALRSPRDPQAPAH